MKYMFSQTFDPMFYVRQGQNGGKQVWTRVSQPLQLSHPTHHFAQPPASSLIPSSPLIVPFYGNTIF